MAGFSTQRVYEFHNETPYNGSADKPLEGESFNNQSYESTLIWFEPTGGYDGIVHTEISPDGGSTWLTTDFRFLNDASNRASSLDFSALGGNTQAIVFVLPEMVQIRLRMSGGTAGALTVKARITDGRYS